MRTVLLGLVACLMAAGVNARSADAASDCASLAGGKIENTNLLSAMNVPAAGDLPGYCRVLGYVRPAINFEIRLPTTGADGTGWNGKFYMAGCGGFCGTLLSDAPGFTNAANYGLRRHYAVASMDSGHWGTSAVDGRWALANPVAKADWAWRAVTETARVSKLLISAFYGEEQHHAYFAGCSTGGRMAGVEASRFPGDFDGIIMGAPALDYTGLVATFFAWIADANTGPDGKAVFPTAKNRLLQDAVAQACDAQLGLVADPAQCRFEPASLTCAAEERPDCLTAGEVAVVEKWYRGPADAHGVQLYPGGLPRGSEANWARWETGLSPLPPLLPLFARDFIRYMAFEPDAGPDAEVGGFDFEHDPARLAPMARLYNAATFDPADPETMQGADLSAFAARGGKLVIYHGWGDPLVTPFLTVAYYEAMARAAGGMDKAEAFARLFMIPGMDHCGINTAGPSIGDTGIDPLTALEGWVEQGRAPQSLLAIKTDAAGKTQWQRPVCAYPASAKLGAGNPAQAASWSCGP